MRIELAAVFLLECEYNLEREVVLALRVVFWELDGSLCDKRLGCVRRM